MRAIIPVAGIGTRLRPHTYTLPKVLLNVAGKPILGHILDELEEQGVEEITVIVGYMSELVEEFVSKYYNFKTTFVLQKELKGLGHSIWMARDTYSSDEPVLIILGDTIFEFDLKDATKHGTSSLGVKEVEDPRRFGVVETDGKFITQLVEKPEHPKSNLAIVGLYYIHNSGLLKESLDELVEKDIKTRGEYQLTDALQLMIDKGEKFTTFGVDGWYDCGKSETMLDTNRFLLNKKSRMEDIPETIIIPPVYIGTGVEIERSVIGPYATIAQGSKVKNSIIRNSIVGDDAIVTNSLLENSIIGNNAQLRGHFSQFNIGNASEINTSK
jgi:glucose-1-phosphate thymidylyltransferase